MSIINSQIATNTKFDASVRNGLESSRVDSAVKGSYRGETVRVHNATQSLFDAMEELTSLGSEKAEKDLTKRKIKDGGVRVNEAHELVSDYLRKVPDLEKKPKNQRSCGQNGGWQHFDHRSASSVFERVFGREKPPILSSKSGEEILIGQSGKQALIGAD